MLHQRQRIEQDGDAHIREDVAVFYLTVVAHASACTPWACYRRGTKYICRAGARQLTSLDSKSLSAAEHDEDALTVQEAQLNMKCGALAYETTRRPILIEEARALFVRMTMPVARRFGGALQMTPRSE